MLQVRRDIVSLHFKGFTQAQKNIRAAILTDTTCVCGSQAATWLDHLPTGGSFAARGAAPQHLLLLPSCLLHLAFTFLLPHMPSSQYSRCRDLWYCYTFHGGIFKGRAAQRPAKYLQLSRLLLPRGDEPKRWCCRVGGGVTKKSKQTTAEACASLDLFSLSLSRKNIILPAQFFSPILSILAPDTV